MGSGQAKIATGRLAGFVEMGGAMARQADLGRQQHAEGRRGHKSPEGTPSNRVLF